MMVNRAARPRRGETSAKGRQVAIREYAVEAQSKLGMINGGCGLNPVTFVTPTVGRLAGNIVINTGRRL
jgi:hypothetical protein